MGKKRSAFLPPLRSPGKNVVAQKTLAEMINSQQVVEASNNAFNLGVSACLIACRDLGFSLDETKEFLSRTFGVLDDVAEDLSRIEEMLKLVNSWGIEIHNLTNKQMDVNGDVIQKKSAVFQLLEDGTTEIEDIIAKCKAHNIKVDYRTACAYRWEYNRVKYYKDIEIDMERKDEIFALLDKGLQNRVIIKITGITRESATQFRYLWEREQGEDTLSKRKAKAFNLIEQGATAKELVGQLGLTEPAANRYIKLYTEEQKGEEIEVVTEGYKKKVFELFDKGHTNAQVRDKLGISDSKTAKLKQEWIKDNYAELTTEEMEEILNGTKPEIVILRHKGVLPDAKAKKHFVPRDSVEKTDKEVKEEKQIEIEKGDVEMKKGSKLEVVSRVVEVKGEFTTYKPVVDKDLIEVDITSNKLALTKEQLKVLAEEFKEVAEMNF